MSVKEQSDWSLPLNPSSDVLILHHCCHYFCNGSILLSFSI